MSTPVSEFLLRLYTVLGISRLSFRLAPSPAKG
jgi:hypothetical protein